MILPNPVSPENSLYYTGSIVLKILSAYTELDLSLLYDKVKSETSMSYELFILTLDWLFLIDAISKIDNKIILCLSKN